MTGEGGIDLELIDSTSCPLCGARKARTHLACGRCWRKVPRRTQQAVYGALASWEDEPNADPEVGRLRVLRDVQRLALEQAAGG